MRIKLLSIIAAVMYAVAVNAQDVKNQLNPVYHGVTSLAIAPDARGGGLGDVGSDR